MLYIRTCTMLHHRTGTMLSPRALDIGQVQAHGKQTFPIGVFSCCRCRRCTFPSTSPVVAACTIFGPSVGGHTVVVVLFVEVRRVDLVHCRLPPTDCMAESNICSYTRICPPSRKDCKAESNICSYAIVNPRARWQHNKLRLQTTRMGREWSNDGSRVQITKGQE